MKLLARPVALAAALASQPAWALPQQSQPIAVTSAAQLPSILGNPWTVNGIISAYRAHMFGSGNDAAGFSVYTGFASVTPPPAGISYFHNTPSQLANFAIANNFSTATAYFGHNAQAVIATAGPTAQYTATTVVLTAPLNPTQLAQVQSDLLHCTNNNMCGFVFTHEATPHVGGITGVSADGSTITVSGWWAYGNATPGQVPANNNDADIDPDYNTYNLNSVTDIEVAKNGYTGYIVGSTLTVTTMQYGVIQNGDVVYNASVPAGTYIVPGGTGTGQTGTYNLANTSSSLSITVGSSGSPVAFTGVPIVATVGTDHEVDVFNNNPNVRTFYAYTVHADGKYSPSTAFTTVGSNNSSTTEANFSATFAGNTMTVPSAPTSGTIVAGGLIVGNNEPPGLVISTSFAGCSSYPCPVPFTIVNGPYVGQTFTGPLDTSIREVTYAQNDFLTSFGAYGGETAFDVQGAQIVGYKVEHSTIEPFYGFRSNQVRGYAFIATPGNDLIPPSFAVAAASGTTQFGNLGTYDGLSLVPILATGGTGTILFTAGGNDTNINYRFAPKGNGTIYSSGGVSKTDSLGLTATGTTLATALDLTAEVNEVTTVASGTGVSLKPWNALSGTVLKQEVINAGANALSVYPPIGTTAIRNLNGSTSAGAAGAATSLAVGNHATFECVSATLCYQLP